MNSPGTRALREEPVATVLLVDDERAITAGLELVLRREPYDIVCAHSAKEALSVLGGRRVDVIVCDEHMPEMNGIELLAIVAARFAWTASILLTGGATLDIASRAINEGRVCRFLTKPCAPALIRAAISDAVRAAVAAAATEMLLRVARLERPKGEPCARDGAPAGYGTLEPARVATLSARELEVLALVLDGKRTAHVAKALFVSPHTARNHLKAIFRKLDVHSQEELLARGRGLPPR
jgi:DNA-binding NarL/FixJ family response regulator